MIIARKEEAGIRHNESTREMMNKGYNFYLFCDSQKKGGGQRMSDSIGQSSA